MDVTAIPFVSALWFGILTSISPCPLATNIAATTFIGKQIETRYGSLVAGLAYTGGRAAAYLLVCFIIVAGLFSIPGVSMFLQQYMNKLLGPLLIVVGLIIIDIIPLRLPQMGGVNAGFASRLNRGGVIGGISLGFIFALSFCPVSAALFFGSVIPLALKFESSLWVPLWYGIGTALPVLGFALLLASGTRYAAGFVRGLTFMERYLRRLTAAVFIGIGVYFTITYLLTAS
ncbi:MAG: aromatic aminobenezylarsenical efflux permease ArsG family transporter [Thermodesulfobacteriota bacterium]|nr:aromatic aminobenezylarsenical efflux permease ArsG family transporter [Thermodesulfobacteriota bacterium]